MEPQLIQQHGLTPAEYKEILRILGRKPNLVELGIFSVMWSEHCSYKSSRIYLKKLPTKGKKVVCGPGENAGVVDIGDGLVVVFKMESHNHPSFIEPYQGAATGVGGILRDVFTMGARPVALLNSLRFGSPSHPKTAHLLNGVVAGIAGYGNCMGIPTVGGEVSFDDCYNGNNLVNAMCVGVARRSRIFYAKASGIGNPVIYVGAKTGRDGIHGATMASDVFDEKSEERRPTVQVGDPFTEKLLMEACLELMKGKEIVGIQDMGAAGLTCSSLEMAGKGKVGIDLDLSQVPLREEKMTPYEIMLSESQERMFLVGKKGSEKKILKLFEKWDLDAAVVGRVTRGDQVTIKMGGRLEGVLPTRPITDKAPVYRRPVKKPAYLAEVRKLDLNGIVGADPRVRPNKGDHMGSPLQPDYDDILKKLLSSPNLSSKKWVYRQYDHMVGTNSVVLPGSDAAVVRIKEPHTVGAAPRDRPGSGRHEDLPLQTKKGLAMTIDCNSRYCYLDPRRGAMIAVAEAARNIICSGGVPLAVTDCLNFGSPENPEVMWQFRETVKGISLACRAFGTPVVSGNVSFYNESRGAAGAAPTAIYPTPTIGMVGLLEDVEKHCTQWFKEEGDWILLVGAPLAAPERDLGGSEYLKVIHQRVAGQPPRLNLKKEKLVQSVCRDGIRRGWIRSAHDCSEGGLAVALAEGCITGPKLLGAEIETSPPAPLLSKERVAADRWTGEVAFLFAETQSRIIVSVREKDLQPLLKLARVKKCPVSAVGRVKGKHLNISNLVNISVEELQGSWEKGFERVLCAE